MTKKIEDEHMKRYSASLAIRKCKSKKNGTDEPRGRTGIKTQTYRMNLKTWGGLEKREPSFTVGGNVN